MTHNRAQRHIRKRMKALFGCTVAGLCALALGACNIRPLYGTSPAGTQAEINELRTIYIPPLKTRAGQVLRNELLFAFAADSLPGPLHVYELAISLNRSSSELIVVQHRGAPQSQALQMRVAYRLTETKSGVVVHKGNSFAQASWNWSGQRFANERAERDAETRAAKVIAEDLRTRIAAQFARKRRPL